MCAMLVAVVVPVSEREMKFSFHTGTSATRSSSWTMASRLRTTRRSVQGSCTEGPDE